MYTDTQMYIMVGARDKLSYFLCAWSVAPMGPRHHHLTHRMPIRRSLAGRASAGLAAAYVEAGYESALMRLRAGVAKPIDYQCSYSYS